MQVAPYRWPFWLAVEERGQGRLAATEMLPSDRCVDQDLTQGQLTAGQPAEAPRLSRSMSAFRTSLTSAPFPPSSNQICHQMMRGGGIHLALGEDPARPANGELRGTDDGGTSWVGLGGLPGGVDVTYENPGAGWGLAATLDCPAAVLRTVDGGASWEPTGCIRAKGQPQAIAATGEAVAVHVGGLLFTSTDGGVTFSEPGT